MGIILRLSDLNRLSVVAIMKLSASCVEHAIMTIMKIEFD